MISFYKRNIKYITIHAVDPDKRRYIDTLEAPRHYLDVENYETNIDSIPEKWKDALSKYGAKHLSTNGTLPRQIQRTYYSLVNAFKTRDSLKILKYSADLGHYIGDAHVPLHTTRNHNGQLTNQLGIHAFWESRLPELFSTHYNFLVGKARYIENPLKEAWKIIKHTHSSVDTVLTFENTLSSSFPSDQKYSFSERNNVVLKQYSADYSRAYQNKMYSAWVDAGQPELGNLIKIDLDTEEKKLELNIESKFQNGNLIGREL